MRALIVEASLKPKGEPSNTRALCRVAKRALESQGVEVGVRSLKGMKYDFNTHFVADDGSADDMTKLLKTVLKVDILIVATPIWWGVHSSLAQSFIERLDDFDNWAAKNKINPMSKKAFASIVSGGGDGFQHIHGLHSAFASFLGFTVPPKSMLECKLQKRQEILTDKKLKEETAVWAKNLVRCVNQLQR